MIYLFKLSSFPLIIYLIFFFNIIKIIKICLRLNLLIHLMPLSTNKKL
jgi:hypothetical protein